MFVLPAKTGCLFRCHLRTVKCLSSGKYVPKYAHLDLDEETQKAQTLKNSQKALFATGLGAVLNVTLASSKGLVGFNVGSTALIADCFNSLGDLFSDAVVYYTVTEARKVATPERPWGTGKFEPLGLL
jgi:Co/Zn/Cd efflux system component